jgi:alkylation response protein AidB-like acyl-CoA dehydrogenase
MLWNFPAGREEKRQVLLNAVEDVREVMEAGAGQAEENGTLPQASVDALYQTGLLALKLPAELGGAEADPVTRLEVIETLARIDSAAAAQHLMVSDRSYENHGQFMLGMSGINPME